MKRKRFFFYALVVVVALSSFSTFTADPPATFLKYKQELASGLSNIEDEICSTFGMSKLRWKLYKKSWEWGIQYGMNKIRIWYQFWGKSLSPRFRAITSRLFKRLNVRFKVLNAKAYVNSNETENLYYGASGGNRVYIDEETMERDNLPDAQIEATILHEISHIIMKYDFTRFCLKKLIGSRAGEVDEVKAKQLYKRFQHLYEELADTFAVLAGGLSTVDALISVYQSLGLDESDTHPSFVARVTYLQRLKSDMQADSYYCRGNSYGRALRV